MNIDQEYINGVFMSQETFSKNKNLYSLSSVSGEDSADYDDSGYDLFFDNNPMGCMLIEIERDRYRHPFGFTIMKVNLEYARLIGLARVTILEKDFYDVLPGGRTDWSDTVIRVSSNGRTVSGTSYWADTDRHLHIKLFLLRRDTMAVMIEDVSTEYQTSGTVARHESLQNSVLRATPELVCRYLPDGTLTYANRAYCEFYEKKREELLGHCFLDEIADEDVEFVRSRLGLLNRDNHMITYKYSIYSKAIKHWLEWTDIALFDEKGTIVEYQSLGRDITEQHNAAEETERVAGLLDDLLYYRTQEYSHAERQASENSNSTKALSTDVEAMRAEIDSLKKRTITGELEICSSCNRIHDKSGSWMVVPMFFENKTAAEVEMEICPYCRNKAERQERRSGK